MVDSGITQRPLALDPRNSRSPIISAAALQKLLRDSLDSSAMLSARTDEAAKVLKAYDENALHVDDNIHQWYLLCRQLRLQATRHEHTCIKLVQYILTMHATLAAYGATTILEPIPEEIAYYVNVEVVRDPKGPEGVSG